MAAELSFFPVDNGDMTLLTLESGKVILIDCNIRDITGDDPPPDVLKQLKERLKKDSNGRYFVDAFLLSHPDQDHCRGFASAFYLGDPADYPASSNKILIKELWSSPLIFRRKKRHETLCSDASAFNDEARRRVRAYRASPYGVIDGNRIQIMGEDEVGKQQGLESIVVKADTYFNTLCGLTQFDFCAYLLAPQPQGNEEEEEVRSKNNSSVIVRFEVAAGGKADACRFLTGGDADVTIWERLWDRHKNAPDPLRYDVLQVPHHCSWHCLSYDSIRDYGDKAKISPDAKSALSQTLRFARLVASCKAISPDDSDPPSHRAMQEYTAIAKADEGRFYETADYNGEPFELEITVAGPSPKTVRTGSGSGAGGAGTTSAVGGAVLGHG